MKIARFVTLIALGAALLAAVDFGYNFFNAWLFFQDGIAVTGLLPRLIFLGGDWTLRGFFLGFSITTGITVALAIANIVLACIDLLRPKVVLF